MTDTITVAHAAIFVPGNVLKVSGSSGVQDVRPPLTFWTTQFHYYHLSWRPWFFKRQRRPFYKVVKVEGTTLTIA